MLSPELVLKDLQDKYVSQPVDARYLRLYTEAPVELRDCFAHFHEQLNNLFGFMNTKKTRGGHFNADPSRELIDLIRDIGQTQTTLNRAGITCVLDTVYVSALEEARKFLLSAGGSAIPDDFGPITLEEYLPIFSTPERNIRLQKSGKDYPLKLIGAGSYAQVFKYKDDEYRMHVAVKKARKTLDAQELLRFRAEYEVLRTLNFPYILKVYGYDESGPSYSMEYCDYTLLKYISEHNNKLDFGRRRRMAQQFLYGINHLAGKQILHRDLSFTNVLVQQFDAGAVQVKLSDFGLHKRPQSALTRTGTQMKGTIIDPTLAHFRDYSLTNEIHAVGHILSYIFTGRENLEMGENPLGKIVAKCVNHDVSKRYTSVAEIISDVGALSAALR